MASDAGGVVGPDVIAACGLSAVPGIGASSLARIAHEFGSLESAIGKGPGAILRANERLNLKQEARDYLARDTDLGELGTWAVGAAKAMVFSAAEAVSGFIAVSRAVTKSKHRFHRAVGSLAMPRRITESMRGPKA